MRWWRWWCWTKVVLFMAAAVFLAVRFFTLDSTPEWVKALVGVGVFLWLVEDAASDLREAERDRRRERARQAIPWERFPEVDMSNQREVR